MTIVWDLFRGDEALEWRRNRFRLTQELMEIFSFSLKFRRFCWFWGFQLASASGSSSLFMKLVWYELWRVPSTWMPSKQIPIHIRTHGDIQVFHFHFADFSDFEHFNRPALQEGAIGSKRMYGLYYGGLRVLEFHRNRFQFPQELMDIFRFFISILLILLILRISTGQPFRKERSIHEACMVCIMQGFERFNSVQTESNSPKNSRR